MGVVYCWSRASYVGVVYCWSRASYVGVVYCLLCGGSVECIAGVEPLVLLE